MKTKSIILVLAAMAVFLSTGCQSLVVMTNPDNGQDFSKADASAESSGHGAWIEVDDGVFFRSYHIKTDDASGDHSKDIQLVRMDPRRLVFSIYENKKKENAMTIREIHQKKDSLVTFNGGFFTEDFVPTGLLVSHGKELHPLSNADLVNGIIGIDNDGRAVFLTNDAQALTSEFYFAIQNGPVLLDENGNAAIVKDSGKTASRTALGIDKDGNLVLVILKQSLLNPDNSITLYQLAHLLKEAPEFADMELKGVVNLDGGPSTGLMVGRHYFAEMDKVQNVVLVKKR